MRTRHGFTLLEALVALSIMATIAAVSFAGLDTMDRTFLRLETERETIGDLSLFFTRMENDMTNAVETLWRNGSNSAMPSMQGGPQQVTFVRLGEGETINGERARRVGYALSSGGIDYMVWPMVDGPSGQKPDTYTAMEGTGGFELSYLNKSGIWIDSWSEDSLPLAVKATVTLPNGETVWRVFDLP